VSLTALLGGDERVREAHCESVRVALSELERYTQARIGNVRAPETTGKFVVATFEHDTARPVEGSRYWPSKQRPGPATANPIPPEYQRYGIRTAAFSFVFSQSTEVKSKAPQLLKNEG